MYLHYTNKQWTNFLFHKQILWKQKSTNIKIIKDCSFSVLSSKVHMFKRAGSFPSADCEASSSGKMNNLPIQTVFKKNYK